MIKKSYITCLQFSYTIKFHFPYNIIYLTNGCDANTISFILPSNNNLNVESSIETPQYKIGFNRSYSKISNFSLMQYLNLSCLMDNKLQDLAHKISEMKHMSIISINSTLTKLKTYPSNSWSSTNVKMLSSIGTSASAIDVIAPAIGLYCKCFWNKKSCVCKHTRPTTMPTNDIHIELKPISNSMPDNSDHYYHK